MPAALQPAFAMRWDPETRVLAVDFARDAVLDLPTAEALDAQILALAGPERAYVGLLVDAAPVRSIRADHRERQARFFRAHKDHVRVAAYNVNAVIAFTINLFNRATGANLRICADEASARAWLAEGARLAARPA